jgi:hypothetical protein
VQRKVPKDHSSRIVLCRADEQIIHIPFDVAPPIRTQRPSTFCEVYLLVGVAIVELEKPVSSNELIALRLVSLHQVVAIQRLHSNGRLHQ